MIMHRVVRFACVSLAALAIPAPGWAQPGALDYGSLGLYEAGEFKAVDGRCADCTPKAALWYFEGDLVAIPRQNQGQAAGFSRNTPSSKTFANGRNARARRRTLCRS